MGRLERVVLRKYRLYALSLVLIWIGAIEVIASFLIKFWFQFDMKYTPLFFGVLILGLCLYLVSKFI